MRTIDAPPLDRERVFGAISRARKKPAVRQRLLAARPRVFSAYGAYVDAAEDVTVLSPADTTPATAKDLAGNYRYLHQPSQDIRAAIFASNAGGQCPLCGQAQASALDHYLPASVFPEFSVLPINLVPVCHPCNMKKGAAYANGGAALYLHAYLDDLSSTEPFLFADVAVRGRDVVVAFRVAPPHSMPATMKKRIVSHFTHLRLDEYYVAEAVAEIGEYRGTIERLLADGLGSRGVRTYLLQEASSRAMDKGPNHWRVALLRGMADCRRLCAGAFLR